MNISMIVLIVLGTTNEMIREEMDRANQEGTSFGAAQHEKGKITEEKKDAHAVLSQPHSTTPDAATPKELTDMQKERRKQQTEALREMKDDELVKNMRAQGSEHLNNPTGILNVGFTSNNITEEVVDCIEPIDKPTFIFQTYERTLILNIFHQDKIQKKRCTRKIKRCTSWWGDHGDDSLSCDTYRWIYPGTTRDIETYQDCERTLGWRFYDYDTVTTQYEETKCTGEYWKMHDPQNLVARVKNNECSLVEVEVIRGKDKTCYRGRSSDSYYGKDFPRDMWHQRMTVMCPGPVTKSPNPCLDLRKKGCLEIFSHPIQIPLDHRNPSKVTQNAFAKRYRCPVRQKESINAGSSGIHCIDGGNLVQAYEKHDDIGEALTHLHVLAEMQKQAQQDWKDPKIFKGRPRKCKKNVLENILYDCCSSLEGFAISLCLTNCNAEEKDLAVQRAEGKCHYVGSIQNEIIFGIHSSDSQVYCCFDSKLMAVLQKEARKQLGKSFGIPQDPDCKGLTIAEIGQLDFSKMDLSELFADVITAAKNKRAQKTDTTAMEASMKAKFETLKAGRETEDKQRATEEKRRAEAQS